MVEQTGAGKQGQAARAAKSARRKIYIGERLPAVSAEMKSLSDERKELLEKRKQAQPDERKLTNRRWNFLMERLDVLRLERAALIDERDGGPSQPTVAKRKKNSSD